jgi:hypothetical protein
MCRAIPFVALSTLVTSAVAAPQPCTSDAHEVVAAIYHQILERDPDPGSRIFMYDIASGRGTVRRNVAEIALSPEHQQRFLWPSVAEAAFRATRNARPDGAQLDGAVRALSSGGSSVPQVVAAYAASEAMTSPPHMRVFVLYTRLLNREPDQSAPRHEQIAERMGIGRLSQMIVQSEEYSERVGPHGIPRYQPRDAYADAVRVLYRHLLGREPDRGGLAAATEVAVARGLPALIPNIVSSPEYMERFGENRVPGPGSGRAAYCGPR